MGDKPSDKRAGTLATQDARKERLASALRDNLKRRKRAQSDRQEGAEPQKPADRTPSSG